MPTVQKRKKTADMPDSPPKRVTRARAKASDDTIAKAKTVKVMTPSAKAAAKKPKPKPKPKPQPLEAPKVTKRKTRADDEQRTIAAVEEEEEEQAVVKEPSKQPANKTRARATKVAEKTEEPNPQLEVPKQTRGRPARTATSDKNTEAPAAPKTRGRAKKDGVDDAKAPAATLKHEEEPALEQVKKTTRSRATVKNSTAATRTATKNTKPKGAGITKKVTFQDEAEKDKENVPIVMQKDAKPATGLRAKPIRRPAATRATTRGKKTALPIPQVSKHTEAEEVQPLSPKKVVQVAKSSSVLSEDELCGEKTPTRTLSRSPVKPPPPSSVRPYSNEVSKLDFGTSPAPSSPTKVVSSSVLQSPARRPPPSPFKDAMKSPPKKSNTGEATPRPKLFASQSPLKSTMKDSPKRGIVPVTLSQPILFSKTPLKSSLLQSPARRPGGSPMKTSTLQSPTKLNVNRPLKDKSVSPKRGETSVDTSSSPQQAASSPFRKARSPGTCIKVHKINNSDENAALEDNSPDPISEVIPDVFQGPGTPSRRTSEVKGPEPFDQAIGDEDEPRSPTPTPIKETLGASSFESHAAQTTDEAAVTEERDQRSTTPPSPVPFSVTAFSLPSSAFKCAVDESESEDELASPHKVFLSTPLKKHGISTHDFGSVASKNSAVSDRRSSYRKESKRQSVAMTPLAVQMSAWLASSPEKKGSSGEQVEQQGLLPTSPTFHESPAKHSFFDDQMAMAELREDSVVDVEMQDAEPISIAIDASQESQASEEYGDENAVPIDHQVVSIPQSPPEDRTITCTPAKVFYAQPRGICTVSKVPLRPAGEDSPLKVPRKRSRSIAGPLASAEPGSKESTTPVKGERRSKPTSPVKPRSSNDDSLIETPRTLRKGGSSEVLKGAVVYVDVHTTEGEDASGIFLELLTQMGARCVKQWSWNPRGSIANFADGEHSPTQSDTVNSKIGITHVVFKDGGKRTMEKVRESRGGVFCVGVGWVLE